MHLFIILVKNCGTTLHQIKQHEAQLKKTDEKKAIIKEKVSKALTTLSKGRVGFEFMDIRPYSDTLGRVFLSDAIEYAKDVVTINQGPFYFDLSILHNSFKSK